MPTIRVELITLSCQVFTSDTLYRLAKRALVYLVPTKMKLSAFHNDCPTDRWASCRELFPRGGWQLGQIDGVNLIEQ